MTVPRCAGSDSQGQWSCRHPSASPRPNNCMPMPTESTPSERFMLEEYRNIAATHDKLRDVGVRLFNLSLILGAAPLALAGALSGGSNDFDLLAPPLSYAALAIAVGFGELILGLALLDIRLGQYRYARTVNLIRRYFATRDTDLRQYLYLPTSDSVPRNDSLGFVKYQLWFVRAMGSLFVGYGVSAWFSGDLQRGIALAVAVVVPWVASLVFQRLYASGFDPRPRPPEGGAALGQSKSS